MLYEFPHHMKQYQVYVGKADALGDYIARVFKIIDRDAGQTVDEFQIGISGPHRAELVAQGKWTPELEDKIFDDAVRTVFTERMLNGELWEPDRVFDVNGEQLRVRFVDTSFERLT